MRRRRRTPHKPRRMDERQVRQILSRGGLLVLRKGVWSIWRTPDARRMRIGIVEADLVAALEAEGVINRNGGEPVRLTAA